jgi:syntaxin 7
MGEVAVDMGGSQGDDLARESKKVQGLIFQMTTSVSSFKRAVDSLGTGKDTKELRGKLNKQRESIGRVAKECSLAVKRLAQSVTNSDDDGRTTHVAQHQKLVKDFHVVLKDFQKAQRTCAERESTFLPQRDPARSPSRTYGAAEDTEQTRESYSGAQERQELMSNEGEMEYNNALIAEREQGIQEIQQQIGEVNEIFQDLAVLVNEQGQMIDDIEANIVSTAVRTKDARRELTKADKSQKAARNKMICLAIVIAVVLIVLILFLLQ